MSTDTLRLWQGPFGNSYSLRNRPEPHELEPVFTHILEDIEPGTVLEPGCNIGRNLIALRNLGWQVTGLEPNDQARHEAQADGLDVWFGTVTDMPFAKDQFDLVLTCGLLIHIPPAEIQQAMAEVVACASKYVLAIEYQAVDEEEQEYRGHRDILWRRPFGTLFEAHHGMRVVKRGGTEAGLYDGALFWLLKK